MSIVNYPFHDHKAVSQPRPMLPIVITNPRNGKDQQTWGLVDTGAGHTVIPGFIGRTIGHDVERGEIFYTKVWGGRQKAVYLHTCSIDILSMDSNGKVSEENDIVIRIPHRKFGFVFGQPIVLLGVEDFLKSYVLSIDYPRQIFSIRHTEAATTQKENRT